VVAEAGKPMQYLGEADYPGSNTAENFWGYEYLPIISSIGSAGVFTTNNNHELVSRVSLSGIRGLTTVYGAVRNLTIGNSNLQLYPANHIAADMTRYSVSVDSQCHLTIAAGGTNLGSSGIYHLLLS
jgi:hypothetical protein